MSAPPSRIVFYAGMVLGMLMPDRFGYPRVFAFVVYIVCVEVVCWVIRRILLSYHPEYSSRGS